MLRSAASPEARGVRPVRDGGSGLRSDTGPAGHLSWADDGPPLFPQLNQGHYAGGHVLGALDNWNRLVLALGHRVDSVLTGLEADVRHAFREGGKAGFHGRC